MQTRLISVLCFFLSTTAMAQIELNVLTPFTTNTFTAAGFISGSEGWLADDKGMLWYTTDEGSTLDTLCTGLSFTELEFIDALNGYGVSSKTAYKTSEGGKSWEPLPINGVHPAIAFRNTQLGLMSGHRRINRTTDGGQSFITIETGGLQFQDFFFLNDSVCVAAVLDDSLNRCIWRSTDGGSGWNNVFDEEKFFMNSIYFVNASTGYAAGWYNHLAKSAHSPAILRSDDGGITWELIYLNEQICGHGEELIDVRFRNEPEGFALSTFSQNIITTDGGNHWEILSDIDTLGISPPLGVCRSIAGKEILYLAGKDGYVLMW